MSQMSDTSQLHHSTEQESRKVAEASRQDKWEKPSFLRDLFLGDLPARPDPSLPARRPGAPRVRGFLRRLRDLPPQRGRLAVEIDRTGEYPAARARRPAQARRLRHEDPQGVRRPRLHERRVPEGDEAPRQLRRQRLGAALGAPVDRRAAAAQALRHRRAEEEVPAALRPGRDLGLRADRARGRLRSGAARDHRRALGRRRRTTS